MFALAKFESYIRKVIGTAINALTLELYKEGYLIPYSDKLHLLIAIDWKNKQTEKQEYIQFYTRIVEIS